MGERRKIGPVPLSVLLVGLVWIGSMGATFVAGAMAYRHRGQLMTLIGRGGSSAVTQANLYNLSVQAVPIATEGRDGAIVPVGEGLLLIGRLGPAWYAGPDRVPQPLELRVPVDWASFDNDPATEGVIGPDLFGVKDALLQPTAGGYRLFVTHSQWYPEQSCNTLRVSAVDATLEQLTGAAAPPTEWRTVYETTPCLELERTGELPRLPLGAGGRLAMLPDGSLLLSVGGFTPEHEIEQRIAQDSTSSYGKVMRIDVATGVASIYTRGHRNPQGLTVSPSGEVWLTEHGARGGDELNRLVQGGNYGYPLVSYGTQYEMMTWPLSDQQGRHEGFDKPIFAWTPGIGISQLTVLERSAFPDWQGDLIISSLQGQSLFHVRVEEDRVIFVEPIPVGHRIRDIAELADGTLALKTDDDLLIYVAPVDASSADLTPEARGALVAAGCQGCHTMNAGGASAIGPNLHGVVGRRIASLDGYAYSDALRAKGGSWNAASLRAFLAAPDSFAPGTRMQLTGTYSEQQLSDLIAYLETLE